MYTGLMTLVPAVWAAAPVPHRPRRTGIEIDLESWSVLTVDDDLLVTRVETYFDHEEAEARRAAGLD